MQLEGSYMQACFEEQFWHTVCGYVVSIFFLQEVVRRIGLSGSCHPRPMDYVRGQCT
jgi:hypothetical protein